MNIIKRLKLLIGIPPEPDASQVLEKYTTMRLDRDCLPVALSNATGRSYEECYRACNFMDLPFFLESPLLSNPYSANRAIRQLGFEPDDSMTIGALAPDMEGKVLILTHDPKNFFNQHWVVWKGYNVQTQLHEIIWGTTQGLRYYKTESLTKLFKEGWPDCAILVK
jgi:hypothetical protein